MTKQDYELIAARIKCSATCETGPNRDRKTWDAAVHDVAELIARGLELENPRFNRTKFLTACGVVS